MKDYTPSTRLEASDVDKRVSTPSLAKLRRQLREVGEPIFDYNFNRGDLEGAWVRHTNEWKNTQHEKGFSEEACDSALKAMRGYFDAYIEVFEVEFGLRVCFVPVTPAEKEGLKGLAKKTKAELNLSFLRRLRRMGFLYRI